MSTLSASLTQKKVRSSSGWGSWTSVSGWDYIRSSSNNYVVYKASIGSGAKSISVSTNFSAAGWDTTSSKWCNTTTMHCYLYTSDPTGSSSPPSNYIAHDSETADIYDYGVYHTFNLTGFSITATTVYLWFSADIQASQNGVIHFDYLISESTGNGITSTPSISANTDGSSGGGGDEGQASSYLRVGHDEGIKSVGISGYDKYTGKDGEYDIYEILTGNKIRLSASLNDGYSFDGWYLNQTANTLSSRNNPYDFTYNMQFYITAKSKINNYTVDLIAGTNVTSVSGGGSFTYGSVVTVTATINTGSSGVVRFDGWYRDDVKVSDSLTYTFTLGAESIVLTAKTNLDNGGNVWIYNTETREWKKYVPHIYINNQWSGKVIPYIYDRSSCSWIKAI